MGNRILAKRDKIVISSREDEGGDTPWTTVEKEMVEVVPSREVRYLGVTLYMTRLTLDNTELYRKQKTY